MDLPKRDPLKIFYTTPEVAKILGRRTQTVRNLIARKQLEAIELEGLRGYHVPARSLEAYLNRARPVEYKEKGGDVE